MRDPLLRDDPELKTRRITTAKTIAARIYSIILYPRIRQLTRRLIDVCI